jgi:hypothetical protein
MKTEKLAAGLCHVPKRIASPMIQFLYISTYFNGFHLMYLHIEIVQGVFVFVLYRGQHDLKIRNKCRTTMAWISDCNLWGRSMFSIFAIFFGTESASKMQSWLNML